MNYFFNLCCFQFSTELVWLWRCVASALYRAFLWARLLIIMPLGVWVLWNTFRVLMHLPMVALVMVSRGSALAVWEEIPSSRLLGGLLYSLSREVSSILIGDRSSIFNRRCEICMNSFGFALSNERTTFVSPARKSEGRSDDSRSLLRLRPLA